MASEKQIAANRANAGHSTGPRTRAGKQKASRNAHRHGLSTPLCLDPLNKAKVDTVIEALLACGTGSDESAAREVAKAQLELLRVRSIRTEMLASLDMSSAKALRRLLAIDRYETQALNKRRRALRNI